MDQEKNTPIPLGVIKRLPIYHRYLVNLKAKEIERISSRELAEKIGITASQLRQDLSMFGTFGQQGYGYKVEDLLTEINRIIGLGKQRKMVLVGAGHLGKAIANYSNFQRRGFMIRGIFDINPTVIGEIINGVTVKNYNELGKFIQGNKIDIGVISVPGEAAQGVADLLVKMGIKGIWNFAPVTLKVPDSVVVEHVHIGESLLMLTFRLQQVEKNNK